MLSRTLAAVAEGIAAGLHMGAQVYVSHRGRVIADWACGEAQVGVAMQPDTLMLWLSSCKPVTAAAICQLWERGELSLNDPVARHIPEFAAHDKEAVTIFHLLTHTAGLRPRKSPWTDWSWDQIIAELCAMEMEPDWIPGRKAGYHAMTSWYLLGEIIRRRTGRACEDFVREEIFVPAGMEDSWMALTPERYARYGERMGVLHKSPGKAGGPLEALDWDNAEGAAICRPTGSVHGPIRELGRFYEMLLHGGLAGGEPILMPETVEAMVRRQRKGLFDLTFKQPIDWGLGFLINSSMYGPAIPYQYGPHASPRTFGHGGWQSSVGCCDPEHGLVVAALWNGCCGETAHDRRLRTFMSSLYEELNLGG